MKNAELWITDGTDGNTLNLFSYGSGFRVKAYIPLVMPIKGGGVKTDSPFTAGSSLVYAIEDDVADNITLSVTAGTQDELTRNIRELRRILRLAVDYWTGTTQTRPVYLKRRAACEAEYTYTAVKMWSTPDDPDIYNEPFISTTPADPDFSLIVIHGAWLKAPPSRGECIPIDSRVTVNEAGTVNLIPNPGFETAGGGGADVFGSWTEIVGSGTIVRDLVDFRSGVASCRLTGGGGARATVSQIFSVPKGDSMRFAYYYKTTSATGYYQIYDITNAAIITEGFLPAAAVYTLKLIDFVLPATCVSVQLKFGSPSANGEIIWFDDSSLVLYANFTAGISPNCPTNLVPNPGFETQASAGVLSSWYSTPGAGAIARDTVTKRTGVSSVLLTGWVTGSAYITGGFYCAAGKNYKFSFYHLNAVAAASFSLFDVYSQTYIMQNVPIPISAAFSRLEYIVPVPAGVLYDTAKVNVIFYSPAVAQTVNIDDVNFEPVENLAPFMAKHLNSQGFLFSGFAPNNITHIFMDENGTWSPNLVYQTPPYNLIRGNLVTYITYFGSATSFAVSGVNRPWAIVCKLFGQLNVGIRGVWQYWTGAAWANLTDASGTFEDWGASSMTSGLPWSREGIVSAVFWPQANEAATTINGITAHWIRLTLTSATAAGYISEFEFVPFYPNRNFVKIPAINSDIPVLAEMRIENLHKLVGIAGRDPKEMAIAIRSVDRGPLFDPVIPFTDVAKPGLFFYGLPANTAFASSYTAPSFRYIAWTPAGSGASTSQISFRLDNPVSQSYKGRYRVYLRAKQTTGTLNDVYYEFRPTSNAYYYSTKHTVLNDPELLDFGIISIPEFIVGENDILDTIEMTLSPVRTLDGQIVLYDLIFIPVDEWYAEIRTSNVFGFNHPNNNPLISSIEPKRSNRGVSLEENFPYTAAILDHYLYDNANLPTQIITPGQIVLPPNRDLFLITLPLDGDFDSLTKIMLFGNPGYYGSRGDI